MKSSFAARRKPRAIARDEPDGNDVELQSESAATISAVKRPGIRSKNPSSRQISFSAGAKRTTSQPSSDDEKDSFVVKKSSLSRQAIAQNAQRRAGIKLPDDRLPTRSEDESRPSYSREELALLKHSTPETPADTSQQDDTQNLDIAAKFGSSYSHSSNGLIPSSAEIAEKKARRARLAQETKFHQDSDSDGDINMPDPDSLGHDSDEDEFRKQVSHVSLDDPRKQKYPETRITHDDEDVLEGFDDFTEVSSGRIDVGVGRKAEREAAAAKRQEMTDMIADAEGIGSSSDDDSDDSDRMRRNVYDAVQTQKAMGLDAANAAQARDEALPPKLPPLPTLGGVIEKLRNAIEECRLMKEAKQREIEDIEQERREIAEREVDVQRALGETAEEYRKLAGEADGTNGSVGIDVNGALAVSATQTVQRGLENLA